MYLSMQSYCRVLSTGEGRGGEGREGGGGRGEGESFPKKVFLEKKIESYFKY